MSAKTVGSVDESIVRHIFLHRIPTNYNVAIVLLDETFLLEKLATVADHLRDISSSQISVASVQKEASLQKLEAYIDNLADEV